MVHYKVSFIQSEPIYFTEEQFLKFKDTVASNSMGTQIIFVHVDDAIPYVQLNLIKCITREEVTQQSNVITPPSPAELRDEKKKEENAKDVSLDAQLNGTV